MQVCVVRCWLESCVCARGSRDVTSIHPAPDGGSDAAEASLLSSALDLDVYLGRKVL